MEKRIIFPGIMFIAAAGSFGFGIWQMIYAQSVQAAATKRLAYVVTTIEQSDVTRAKKQELYASIATGLPASPNMLGLDFSGSLASPGDDHCASDGQRAICHALKQENADTATRTAVCGVCDPKL